MAFKGGIGENRLYLIIAALIIIVIILSIFFSSNQLVKAYIDDEYLNNLWIEDINDRTGGSSFLGLEKWSSFTYAVNDSYPAELTVNTYKFVLMISEQELISKTIDTIKGAKSQGININQSTKITGSRMLLNGHSTNFVIYDANDTTKDPFEQVKIIGECWNCGPSGTSIICIGVAQITDNANNNANHNYTHWAEIIKDKDGTFGSGIYQDSEGGLIFNSKCH